MMRGACISLKEILMRNDPLKTFYVVFLVLVTNLTKVTLFAPVLNRRLELAKFLETKDLY